MIAGPTKFPEFESFNVSNTNEPPSFFNLGNNLSAPLYRYTKFEHHQAFCENGIIRLSTLWSFHDMIKFGDEQGDREEAVRSFHSSRETHKTKVPVSFFGNAVNQWSLCTTRSKNDRFYPEFSADCCVKINSLQYFIEIAKAAREHSYTASLFNILYIDKEEIVEEAILEEEEKGFASAPFLAATKARRYAWQCETRLLIEPPPSDSQDRPSSEEIERLSRLGRNDDILNYPHNHPNLQPIFLHAPDARQFTELVERI